jgi:hypothetical protein
MSYRDPHNRKSFCLGSHSPRVERKKQGRPSSRFFPNIRTTMKGIIPQIFVFPKENAAPITEGLALRESTSRRPSALTGVRPKRGSVFEASLDLVSRPDRGTGVGGSWLKCKFSRPRNSERSSKTKTTVLLAYATRGSPRGSARAGRESPSVPGRSGLRSRWRRVPAGG